ncbi:MAG: DNA polymerase I [Bacteroidia bacterium]|nr:DNA polymerase I [Bacteroidia bacterium]
MTATHQKPKLFLLDGMALVYRAYFAFSKNPRITSYGFNTSAIFGYVNTILDVIKKEKPTHIGVSFDTSAPTARHEEYEHYKAHREEMPEDLAKALPYIRKVTEAMRIPLLIKEGYEADDIIGTLAKKAEKKGYEVYMMTPDKDFGQLVSENIFIYKPARMGNEYEILGVPEVLKRWEITNINQVIDILGMWGDAVDNIPGIPGIGEKTAKLFVQKYGSMEGLYEHVHELKGKQKENVENNKEQAFLSKRLATIDQNVPIELIEEDLMWNGANKEEVEAIFTELEFKTLAKRLFNTEAESSVIENKIAGNTSGTFDLFNQGSTTTKPAVNIEANVAEKTTMQTIESTAHNYILLQTDEQIKSAIEELMQQNEVAFDTETESLEKIDNAIVGFSFSYKPNHGFYIACNSNYDDAKRLLHFFKPIFESEAITKVIQNIKFDLMVLNQYGLTIKGPVFDTMLAHYLIEPDLRHGMDYLSEIYLNYQPVAIENLIGKKGKKQLSMREVEIEKVKEYAVEDTDITLQLKQKLSNELIQKGATNLLYEIEQPLVPVLASMELEGVKINKQFLEEYSKELEAEIAQLEKRILQLAGVDFNISSPKQLGEVLFEHLRLDDKAKKTKTGQYQTGEDVLQGLTEHEIVRCILDIRQLQKLKSTYVDALPVLINNKTGRVHTSFNQAVAATGRLSSNNPNIQNIPIRTDKGKEVRKAFVPRNEDYVLLSADYSQIELRIIASMAEERNMIDAFKQGLDIHAATAARVYNVDVKEVTAEQRRNAKAVNFGIIYGQSAFGLSQNLGISRKEAIAIIDEYWKQYPAIKQYMNTTINFAKDHGYVQTLKGRRRYLRDINSANFTVRGFAERNAINAPIQGSAADMIKIAMINIHEKMNQHPALKSKMILQVHDELLFDVHKEEVSVITELVKKEMENAMELKVPVVVEIGLGENWLEAH